MMAARGLAPMGPGELLTALYQLTFDNEDKIAGAAREAADGLPDKILAAGLGDALDVRVLDFFAQKVISRGELVERVLLNPATDDQTFLTMAGQLAERELETMAGNQQRLLRCPAIIEAIYFNRQARMSTVDRLLEMAVRNGLTLDRVPQYKEIAAHILGGASPEEPAAEPASRSDAEQRLDQAFAAVISEQWDEGPVDSLEFDAENEQAMKATLSWRELSVSAKIRQASIGGVFQRMLAIRDANRTVALAAIASAGVNEQEAARYAADRGLSEEVVRYIAYRKEWLKNYQVKLNLVKNPKCPLAQSMRLLRHLRPADVKLLSRSKAIPAALAQAARQHLAQRR
jgi:hypothetical protein